MHSYEWHLKEIFKKTYFLLYWTQIEFNIAFKILQEKAYYIHPLRIIIMSLSTAWVIWQNNSLFRFLFIKSNIQNGNRATDRRNRLSWYSYSMQTHFLQTPDLSTKREFQHESKNILLFHLNFKIFYVKVKNYYYLVMVLKAFQ